MDPQDLPDGEVFRKGIAYVLKQSGTGKVVHQGVFPETKIINLIDKLLQFMNDEQLDIPNVIKVAVGHYYFGYIHPFYDGNGRTARFISSMYLAKDLGNISSLALSRGCNKYKSKYLEAFEISNSIRSRGEMNSFIETFLEIMIDELKAMNAELKEKSYLLDIAAQKINSDTSLSHLPKVFRDFMFVMAQNYFFDSSSGLTVAELSNILGKSPATVRKMAKYLLDLSLVEQKGERPAYYGIAPKYFEQ